MQGLEFQYDVTQEDIQGSGEFTQQYLPTEDYICRIVHTNLEKVPKWNASKNKFDYNDTESRWVCILQPYKLKSGDDMVDSTGKEIKPLALWIWRQVNPFTLGFNKDGEPSHQRAIISYSNGEQPEGEVLKISHIIVLDKENNPVPESTAVKYLEELKQKKEGKITDDEMIMKRAGYKHIPDLKSISQGKYISCKIVLVTDGKGNKRNKITGFSKVPSSFKPDITLESEAQAKFKESYTKMIEKRKEKNNVQTTNANTVVNSIPTNPSQEEISIEDIPF